MGGENDPDAPEPAAVLEAVKARPGDVGVCRYGGATAGRDSSCARRRRKSAVGAEESKDGFCRGAKQKIRAAPCGKILTSPRSYKGFG